MPFVSRTRATFRRAEFGFFGVEVNTRTQTPRFCGHETRAGLFVRPLILSRPQRTSWLTVGILFDLAPAGAPFEKARRRNSPDARMEPRAPTDWRGFCRKPADGNKDGGVLSRPCG